VLVGLCAWDAGEPSIAAGIVSGRLELREGDRALLALVGGWDEPLSLGPRADVEDRIDATVEAWRLRVRDHPYDGPWQEAVERSALVISLLADARAGAIIAAPTTSLPERIGGDSNYDYRYAWVRDTSFTLDALLQIGYREQAHRSLTWLLDAVRLTHPRLQPFYGLDGRPLAGERELDLRGYRDSRPVRVGNEASGQLQLDAYGELFATVSHYLGGGNILDPGNGERLADVANLVCDLWRNEDSGVWELQEQRHYTQSKLACWVALDCALHLAEQDLCPRGHVDRWRRERDAISSFVETECWSDARGSYVRATGGDELDAACLLAARREYGGVTPERVHSTVDAVRRELARGPLVFRFTGAEHEEGAFVGCSFWLIEALARTGRREEATALMDELVALANDVGLFSEQIDPESHEFLGNFPQGLSHLALATAAFACAADDDR
jgi:GH15 family glucan-1,4-alpha-glucosidase